MRRLRDSEDGSILPLAAFYCALALAVVLIATAASSLYLERKRLHTIADGAALAGAEAFDLTSVTFLDGAVHPVLRSDDVAFAAARYVNQRPADGIPDVSVVSAKSDDGLSASVTLSAVWRPPVVSMFAVDGIRIEVSSSARSVFF